MEPHTHNTDSAQGQGARGQKDGLTRLARARAFTIAEGLIASVVLAASVVGISGTLTASYQQTEVLKQKSEAVSLARQLLEQISACAFDDPDETFALGPDGSEATTGFDNIDDYDGYTDTSSAGGVPTASPGIGDAETAVAVYSRSASVQYYVAPGGNEVEYGPFALVTVTVQSPSGADVTLNQLMSDYTPAD